MDDLKKCAVRRCGCVRCRQSPRSETARRHRAVNRVLAMLDERRRRLFVGLLASQYGRGGIEHVVVICGLSRNTIRRGLREIRERGAKDGRVRRSGAGRLPVEKKGPTSSKP